MWEHFFFLNIFWGQNLIFTEKWNTITQNTLKPNAKEGNLFFEWETDSFPHLQSATELFEMTLFSGDDDGWCKIINAFPKGMYSSS